MDIYKTKAAIVKANQLDTDIMIHYPNGNKEHVQAGDYLICLSDNKIMPVGKSLFEYLFEKEEQK